MSGPGLNLLDLTLATPEENLALDEALLLDCEAAAARGEAAGSRETLRFWESPHRFVALGVAARLRDDVEVEACARERVPILRRSSGGGTVLQGPGCVNFALVLSLASRPELRDVTRSYGEILRRVAASLRVPGLEHRGTSDLALEGRKVSGSAQKRTRHALLHHGTILHALASPLLGRLLREPVKQPDYRARRRHEEFVANLPLPVEEIKARIARAWDAEPKAERFLLPDLGPLIREKYGRREWTERF